MRLLQIGDDGALSLVEQFGAIPPYAILSHTWGFPSEEITYQDMINNTAKAKAAYLKIQFCVEQAKKDNLKHFWIDTCCIDKSSSAELSEAIISMFRWYQESTQCYVYLSDVSSKKRGAERDTSCSTWESKFRTSRWFSRGWTLQELLAPRSLIFFSREGQLLGNKSNLEQLIHEVTQIPILALRNVSLEEFDIKERLSWATKRQTTREEDEAYSLLGIFSINMLPMYGEGRKSALKRLNNEISGGFYGNDEEQRTKLMSSLRFDQIDLRYMTIRDAHANTCKWLLDDLTYSKWLDFVKYNEHHGFLWIKGKPGTGKSTLMKYALAQAHETPGNTTVISFFFNARGEHIERSTIGTYRSLLLQLLERHPALQKTLDSLKLPISWTIELLKSLIRKAIMGLGRSSLVCFIDALDECEEQQIRDMVRFFEHLGEIAVSNNVHFRTCFSSRHYPYITIEKGLSLVLEGQDGHTQDITNYLQTELRIGNSTSAESVREKVQEKASGIFIWVVLVTSILNKEHDSGRIHKLHRKLQELPSDLNELFRDILIRDVQHKAELVLCIQWMLFAKHTLSPEELYCAVLSGTEPEAFLLWEPNDAARKVIVQRFILDASKGLAEITTSYPLRVQFIHESVLDFLLKENGLGEIWPEYGLNFRGQSHERLKQCCLTYMDPNVTRLLLTLRRSFLEPLPQRASARREEITKVFPLLDYVIHNIFYHADAAEASGITQRHFLDTFPLPWWIELHNLLAPYETQNYTYGATLVYILVELNMVNLYELLPLVSLCLEIGDERYGCPLFAAIVVGNEEAVQACLGNTEAAKPLGGSSPKVNHDSGLNSLGNRSRKEFAYSRDKGVFSSAVELRRKDVFDYLLRLGKFDTDWKDSRDRTPLWWACKKGWEDVVRFLLNKGTDVIDLKTEDGTTSLHIALAEGHKCVVELLLDAGADVSAQGGYYGNALQAASRLGHKEVVRLLLDRGANVNTQGGNYTNALQAASYGGHDEIVSLLLDREADVNAQGGYYGNALQVASFRGYSSIVRVLLNKGANVNAHGGFFNSALQAASYRGRREIVLQLLNEGADPNAEGGLYKNALSAASIPGHKDIVTLLIDNGALLPSD